jgi:hypothetical protein
VEDGVEHELQLAAARAEDRVESGLAAGKGVVGLPLMANTAIVRPAASATEAQVTTVESACWRRLRRTSSINPNRSGP